VVKNIGVESIQPYGLLVGDEMYLVPFIGQRFAQLRSQYAASAKCGITNDA
jgi:hypothetical protein